MLKVGIVATNLLPISKNTRKGTEIFVYRLIHALSDTANQLYPGDFHFKLFAGGDSEVPVEVISNIQLSTSNNPDIAHELYKQYEVALFSQALNQKDIDIFHINVSNGEWILPFCRFISKPVVITMHGGDEFAYEQNYFKQFINLKNVFFVSISNSQRKKLPNLNYINTIYHGIKKDDFNFSPNGGDYIMWAGRTIPEKGLEDVITLTKFIKEKINIYPVIAPAGKKWWENIIYPSIQKMQNTGFLNLELGLGPDDLKAKYRQAKLFLLPTHWEEPFGMVMIESLASGTPVVAYARGSASEIIKDGINGLLVNPSENDIRGEFIIKETGFKGLSQAINYIYSLNSEKYIEMRHNAREIYLKNFEITKMATEYLNLYKSLI